jgi:hypothetical protein
MKVLPVISHAPQTSDTIVHDRRAQPLNKKLFLVVRELLRCCALISGKLSLVQALAHSCLSHGIES